jgi:hypothetical protein
MGAPFHRSDLLRPKFGDVGIGFSQNDTRGNLTIDFAQTAANTQGAPGNPQNLIIWPYRDMTDVPTAMLGETPDPIAENAGAPAGYAASVQVNSAVWRSLGITKFEMRESATGALVNTKLLANPGFAEDPALAPLMGQTVSSGYYDRNSFTAIIPKAPLKRNTKYSVEFVGQVAQLSTPDYAGRSEKTFFTDVRQTWSFTTGDKLDY